VVAIESILGVGDLSTENVRIVLRSGQDISLAGWRLLDSDGNRYTFPQLDLFAGGAVHLNTRTGLDTANNLYWGLDTPVWQPGETAVLQDAQGNQQAVYEIP
jgi:micrococcal nuclease